MRIIVVSDTHGDFWSLHEIVEKHQRDADFFIHLGDGARELAEIKEMYPDQLFYSVRGNCDLGSREKEVGIITAGEVKILYTHGHLYHVKYGLYDLEALARENHAQIALYGHTHRGETQYEDGLYIMNPGSPSRPRDSDPSYGIVDITKAGIVLNLVKIKP